MVVVLVFVGAVTVIVAHLVLVAVAGGGIGGGGLIDWWWGQDILTIAAWLWLWFWFIAIRAGQWFNWPVCWWYGAAVDYLVHIGVCSAIMVGRVTRHGLLPFS